MMIYFVKVLKLLIPLSHRSVGSFAAVPFALGVTFLVLLLNSKVTQPRIVEGVAATVLSTHTAQTSR